MKASANLIIHAAVCHLAQGVQRHIAIFRVSRTFVLTQQKAHGQGAGEFGRSIQPAMAHIVVGFVLLRSV